MSDHSNLPRAADANNSTSIPLPESAIDTTSSSSPTAPSLIGNDDAVPTEIANDSIPPSNSEVKHSFQVIAPFKNDEWPLQVSGYLEYRPNITYYDEDEASLNVASPEEIEFAAFKILDTFTVFPRLPLELRRQVWKAAIVPRLVHWRPGGGKPPGIMHACSESRAETFKAYTRVELKYQRHHKYSLFINYELDILYRKQDGLPIPERDPVSRKLFTPAGTEWCTSIKRLAINLDRAAGRLRIPNQRPGRPFRPSRLWRCFKISFPRLEELVVIMYPNLERGDSFEDLVEVSNRDVEEETVKDYVQQIQPARMDSVRASLLERERMGYGHPLKLTFMRVPVERRRRLCESCFHVIDKPGNRESRGGFVGAPTICHGRFCNECVDRKFKALGIEDRYLLRGEDRKDYQDPENPLW